MAKRTKAIIGEMVSFERQGRVFEGIVFKVNEKSVLVNIPEQSRLLLGYETNKTVVGHRNYLLKNSNKEVSA